MSVIDRRPSAALSRYEGVCVAVVEMTAEMRDHLVRQPTRLASPTFTIPDTAGLIWKRNRRYLTVFKTDMDGEGPFVVGLGLMIPARMASDFTRRIQVERFQLLEDRISVSAIREQLGDRYADAIRHGPPSDARARRLLEAVSSLNPGAATLIDVLSGIPMVVTPLSDAATEVRSFEKDAAATLLDAVIGERNAIRGAGLIREDEPFVQAMPGHNDVNHDWLHFADWKGTADVSYGIRRFQGPDDQELVVCNITKRRPEDVDGVDLLYYNELHGCFMLVQYKRFLKRGRGTFCYPGDDKLDEQLQRLRAIDDRCPPGGELTDIRLHSKPSFFKLCEPSAFDQDSIDMLKGVYLARPHFERIFEGGAGLPGDSRYQIGKGEVPRHLNTSAFTMLLAHGWIGSCGVGSDYVREQAQLSLSMRGNLVFGLHRSERPAGNSSNRWG